MDAEQYLAYITNYAGALRISPLCFGEEDEESYQYYQTIHNELVGDPYKRGCMRTTVVKKNNGAIGHAYGIATSYQFCPGDNAVRARIYKQVDWKYAHSPWTALQEIKVAHQASFVERYRDRPHPSDEVGQFVGTCSREITCVTCKIARDVAPDTWIPCASGRVGIREFFNADPIGHLGARNFNQESPQFDTISSTLRNSHSYIPDPEEDLKSGEVLAKSFSQVTIPFLGIREEENAPQTLYEARLYARHVASPIAVRGTVYAPRATTSILFFDARNMSLVNKEIIITIFLDPKNVKDVGKDTRIVLFNQMIRVTENLFQYRIDLTMSLDDQLRDLSYYLSDQEGLFYAQRHVYIRVSIVPGSMNDEQKLPDSSLAIMHYNSTKMEFFRSRRTMHSNAFFSYNHGGQVVEYYAENQGRRVSVDICTYSTDMKMQYERRVMDDASTVIFAGRIDILKRYIPTKFGRDGVYDYALYLESAINVASHYERVWTEVFDRRKEMIPKPLENCQEIFMNLLALFEMQQKLKWHNVYMAPMKKLERPVLYTVGSYLQDFEE